MNKNQDHRLLSVTAIIPTYNERDSIHRALEKVSILLKNRDYEIIVVDDSSPDNTKEVVLAAAKKNPKIRLITRKKKEGIGAALREGYNAAKKEVIFSVDADLEWPIKDADSLLVALDEGADIALGSRYVKGGKYQNSKSTSFLKKIVSKSGNIVLKILLGLPVHDITCNFRAMKTATWKKIKTKDTGNALLAEVVLKAHKKGCHVTERPVRIVNRGKGISKISIIKHYPKMFFRILAYRYFRK